jgi:hypothetical protein
MNIFMLDSDSTVAAAQQCDKHCVKMVLETAQILSAVCARYGVIVEGGYRVTHKHHPCTIWAGDSRTNFDWLVEHGRALATEYTRRYGRVHKSLRVINLYAQHRDVIPDVGWTEPAQAMPEECRVPGDAVAAYRKYYNEHKSRVMSMTWRDPSQPPPWFTPHTV